MARVVKWRSDQFFVILPHALFESVAIPVFRTHLQMSPILVLWMVLWTKWTNMRRRTSQSYFWVAGTLEWPALPQSAASKGYSIFNREFEAALARVWFQQRGELHWPMGQRYFDLDGRMSMHLMCRVTPPSYSLFNACLDSDTAHVYTRQPALKCNREGKYSVASSSRYLPDPHISPSSSVTVFVDNHFQWWERYVCSRLCEPSLPLYSLTTRQKRC